MQNQQLKDARMAPIKEREAIIAQQERGEFSLSKQLEEHPVSHMKAFGLGLRDDHPLSILAARHHSVRA